MCVFQMFLPGQEILAQRRVVDSNQLPVALRESQQTNHRHGIRGFVGELKVRLIPLEVGIRGRPEARTER